MKPSDLKASIFQSEQDKQRRQQTARRDGLYFGIVESTDDPQIRARVKVRIYPFQADTVGIKTENLPWARQMGRFGGRPDEGEHQVPRVGAQVVVAFIEGDPDHPIVLGAVPAYPNGQSEVHREVKACSDDVQMHVLAKTPKGHKIILEDNGDNQEILIMSAYQDSIPVDGAGNKIEGPAVEGHYVRINDTTDRIEVHTVYGHYLEMDDPAKYIRLSTGGGHVVEMDDPGKYIDVKTIDGHNVHLDDPGKYIEVKTIGGHIARLDDPGKFVKITTIDGHVIEMNDTSQFIKATTKGGHIIDMNDQVKNILIQTALGNKVNLDDQLKEVLILTPVGYQAKLSDTTQDIALQLAGGLQSIVMSHLTKGLIYNNLEGGATLSIQVDGNTGRMLFLTGGMTDPSGTPLTAKAGIMIDPITGIWLNGPAINLKSFLNINLWTTLYPVTGAAAGVNFLSVLGSNVSLNAHKHDGVTSGSAKTDEPVN